VIYQISNLNISIKNKTILHDINFEIANNNFLALIGKNGAGKTTLIKAMLGLLKPKGGEIYFKDRLLSLWGDEIFEKVGVVLQNPDHQIFSLSVIEEIEFVLKNFKQDEKKALDVLKKFDFERFKDSVPFYLSEGEKKKLCIISILAHNPEILILDEPFSTLDWQERNVIFQFLRTMKDKTIIVTTHDLHLAKLFTRILLLEKGRLIGNGSFSELQPTLKKVGLIDGTL